MVPGGKRFRALAAYSHRAQVAGRKCVIKSTRGPLRITDFYFDEQVWTQDADIVRYNHWSTAIPNAACRQQHTIVIDLTKDDEALLSAMHKKLRYDLRRAAAENLSYKMWCQPCGGVLDGFCRFYDSFALSKSLAKMSRRRLQALARADSLVLTEAKLRDRDLVWHAYIRTGARVRLLHSASLYRSFDSTGLRQTAGRANRWLHWKDIASFKTEGLRVLDLGGWYAGSHDQEKQRINNFKEEFGGSIVTDYQCTSASTVQG